MSGLSMYLQELFETDEQTSELIASRFREEKIAKGEYFVKQGSYCKRLSFVRAGYLRTYMETESKEVTQWIGGPDYFVTELSSLMFDKPARWNIQALTDSVVETISQSDYKKLNDEIPNWEGIQNKFMAKCFGMLEDRVFSFLAMSAEERYQHLWSINKELFNQVPLQHIASMLGMSPETLSRIRRKNTS